MLDGPAILLRPALGGLDGTLGGLVREAAARAACTAAWAPPAAWVPPTVWPAPLSRAVPAEIFLAAPAPAEEGGTLPLRPAAPVEAGRRDAEAGRDCGGLAGPGMGCLAPLAEEGLLRANGFPWKGDWLVGLPHGFAEAGRCLWRGGVSGDGLRERAVAGSASGGGGARGFSVVIRTSVLWQAQLCPQTHMPEWWKVWQLQPGTLHEWNGVASCSTLLCPHVHTAPAGT